MTDELAHTNASGSHHEKPSQDVEEVPGARIGVHTTLNIQHIEAVARITGVRVREAVQDGLLEMADEVELIDLPPDDLLERLKRDKVYPTDQVARALGSFFVKGNLTALRELAMRAAAASLDDVVWASVSHVATTLRCDVVWGFRPEDQLDVLIDQIPLALERLRLPEYLATNQLASEAERLRTALSNSVSHDLRTPLVTIIGAAGSLAETDLDPAARRDLAENIREEGERLDRHELNLLDMTRLGHGALKPRLVPVDLAEILGAARHRMRGVLQWHGLQIEMPEAFPLVLADAVLLE